MNGPILTLFWNTRVCWSLSSLSACMLPIRLALLHEPTADEALEQILSQTPSTIPTFELLSFDYFTRIFCPCGRHTYGDLEVEQFTKERYVPDAHDTDIDYWIKLIKRVLAERQARYTKHAGRASLVCCKCTCTSAPGHHHILDLTRPFVSTAPDQYQLPLHPLWQGAPFCKRFMTTFHDMGTHYLIERTDNLWVYVHTRDCNATPVIVVTMRRACTGRGRLLSCGINT